MTSLDLITQIEDMCRRAWPAAEIDHVHGWELRAAGGYTRRANTANPFPPHPSDLDSAVYEVERWYRGRRLRPAFRMTPISNPRHLETLLSSRGYTVDRGTHVMVGPAAAGPPVEVTPAPSAEWIAAKERWTPVPPKARASWRALLGRTGPEPGYGLVRLDGRVVAAGHAVVEGDLVALFGLVVDPEARRRGFGEQLSRGLIGWGAEHGATTVWLQVHTPSNPGAVALYEQLGLSTLYEYWYLEAPPVAIT